MVVRNVLIVGWCGSKCQIYLTFGTSDVGGFLVFGVLNTKKLVFVTPDINALTRQN